MPSRVLITGITGMAGSHLADFLLNEVPECLVYGTKRWRSKLDNISHLLNNERLQLMDDSITDASSSLRLIETIKPDFIFHLAAHSFVPDSWRNPHVVMMENMLMQLHLFEAVRHTKIDPTIQIALSSEQYGKVFPDELPISEKNPFRPLSPYAVSKVGQDMMGYQYWASYGMKIIRTRAFNHEGPRRGEVFVTSNFAKQIALIEAGKQEPIIHVGNLNAKRDWTDVRDMVRAYWLAVHHCTPGEDYIIGSGVSRSVQEMLDCLLSFSKIKIEIMVDPARIRPSDVDVLQAATDKFKKATDWKPRYTFDETMHDLLEYWRDWVRSEKVSVGTVGEHKRKA